MKEWTDVVVDIITFVKVEETCKFAFLNVRLPTPVSVVVEWTCHKDNGGVPRSACSIDKRYDMVLIFALM